MKQSQPKYGNHKVSFEGETFDSRRELERWLFLRDAERRGLIRGLERQVRFELVPAVRGIKEKKLKTRTIAVGYTVQRALTYTCDFRYVKNSTGETVVEDVKISPRMLPKEYVLKEKLMLALKGIKIKRVYKPAEEV